MAITDYYKTDFTVAMLSKTKVNGRYVASLVSDPTIYKCAIFTPSTSKEVVVGKISYTIIKTLYCAVTVPIQSGDVITVDGTEFNVGNIKNTNNVGNHYQIDLIERVL